MKLSLASIDLPEEAAPPPSTRDRVWSPQQSAVFAAVLDKTFGSIRVDAVAGAGKTTTLVEACRLMTGRIAFAAFNRKIADEIKFRVGILPNVTCGTLHSFGLKAWKQTAPGCVVDGDKLHNLCDELHVPYWAQGFTKFMVSVAKSSGHKYPVAAGDWQAIADHYDAMDKLGEGWDSDPDRDPFEQCNPLLKASIECSDQVIDFDDMLYMPLCYGSIKAEYDWILVDEAQDTNRVRRMLVEALLLPGGRVCVVGDEHQAIYGFTGADAAAMDNLEAAFSCSRLPLTITYRCPKVVVAHARQWVSHIEAAASAPEGTLRNLNSVEFDKLGSGDFLATDAILCRNTRPLVSLALSLIRRNISCRVEGRDIGQSLLTLVNRWKTANTLSKLQSRLESHQHTEGHKLRGRGQQQKAAQLDDKINSLIAVMESLGPNGDITSLKARINSLFGDTEPGKPPRVCTLSTIHKAKGREWDRVYLLGREQLMPSKWARQDWELQQEKNLIYVAVTRAKRELIEVEYLG